MTLRRELPFCAAAAAAFFILRKANEPSSPEKALKVDLGYYSILLTYGDYFWDTTALMTDEAGKTSGICRN